MPDSRSSYDIPRGWDDAFAALPLEAPDADRWASIARRLPRRQSSPPRRHRRYWQAVAAAAALAAAVPAFWWTEHDAPPLPRPVATAPAPAASTPAPSKSAASAAALPAAAADRTRRSVSSSAPENAGSSISATAAATAPRFAKPARPSDVSPGRPQDSAAVTTIPRPDIRLEDLYAESARLEAILGQLQEPRVASATAAALSAGLQDRVADIDTALSQADLPSSSQHDLWQQRVQALRQLTGVETTQRWMAAQGTATEGSLAQVY
jgi:hypothetical protein